MPKPSAPQNASGACPAQLDSATVRTCAVGQCSRCGVVLHSSCSLQDAEAGLCQAAPATTCTRARIKASRFPVLCICLSALHSGANMRRPGQLRRARAEGRCAHRGWQLRDALAAQHRPLVPHTPRAATAHHQHCHGIASELYWSLHNLFSPKIVTRSGVGMAKGHSAAPTASGARLSSAPARSLPLALLPAPALPALALPAPGGMSRSSRSSGPGPLPSAGCPRSTTSCSKTGTGGRGSSARSSSLSAGTAAASTAPCARHSSEAGSVARGAACIYNHSAPCPWSAVEGLAVPVWHVMATLARRTVSTLPPTKVFLSDCQIMLPANMCLLQHLPSAPVAYLRGRHYEVLRLIAACSAVIPKAALSVRAHACSFWPAHWWTCAHHA